MSCGVGQRHGSDPALLWLWLSATVLIRPIAWETLYAMGTALKIQKKKKKSLKNINRDSTSKVVHREVFRAAHQIYIHRFSLSLMLNMNTEIIYITN